jgi:hypothetical protein
MDRCAVGEAAGGAIERLWMNGAASIASEFSMGWF